MGESTDRFPAPGAEFAGRYVVRAPLSDSGSTSRLYVATDSQTGVPVALKVVVPANATDPQQLVQRFDREAKALSMVNAASCIDLLDYGHIGGELLFMAFEWVDGPTLGGEIAEGPLGLARTLSIMRQLLEVLQELHNAGIIHRDIKPSHIMLTMSEGKPDRVKLLDFAIAKSWTHTAQGEPLLGDLTQKGRMMGTPRYMSPEQVVGRRVVPQSDLYSLGLVVLEMLTGKHANPGDDVVVVVQRHLSEEDFAIPEDIPEELYVALRRMLAKPLNARPKSANEVLGMIGPLMAATEATAGDETIPISSFVESATQDVGTDPDVPVLGLTDSEEPTLPPDEMGDIVDAAVAHDETVKLDNSVGKGPVPQPTGVAMVAGAKTFDPSDTGRIAVQREDDDALELDFPRSAPLQAMIQMGVAAIITFVVAILLHPILAVAGLGTIAIIFGTSRVDRKLRFDRDGWTLTSQLWKWQSTDSGSIDEVHGITQDTGTILMTTDQGTHTIAGPYEPHEALAVCQRANEWLTSRKW